MSSDATTGRAEPLLRSPVERRAAALASSLYTRDSHLKMVDIEKYLLPKIRARWGDQPIEDARGTEYKAIFGAKHPEVGEICVSDEREEITIFVGTIAHQHFYDRGWPEEEFQYSSEDDYADKISDEAVEWLEQVFADEVWFSRGLMVSSIGYRGPGRRGFLRRLLFPVQRYVWSGPLDE